jgi:NAD+ kinase
VLEAEKRPVSAAADHFETRNVVKVEIEQARAIELYMMFDRNHGLEERLLAEQFSF